ncbi:Female sterile M3-like protein [Daphnia magna]|uniref:Female sterile M3-like protein n=1 Tax=Daphnia magna TaxID=35525 RepID=A0A162QPG0_9CRUS|nr:Female sterile M3-like protein [Daphnia magna]
MAHVEELKNNVVHFKDNVTANGTVVIAQMNFSQSPVIDTIKVLYNFSEGFVRPKEIESKKSLPKNTKSFVLHKLHHFYGSSTSQWCIINGRDWDEFSRQAWRYSSPDHTVPHHVLDVRGNIDVGNNSINGVAVVDTLRKNTSHLVIQGTKSFSAIEVKNNVKTNTVNEGMIGETDSTEKRERAAFHWIGADRRSCSGFVNFTVPLLVDDAEVDSLNDLLIKDLLSTSGQQTILASIEVDVLDAQGNIGCPDINERNVDDFLYSDENDTHIVLGQVQISDDLVINNLVMENGSFNSVDIIKLLDPPSLRIDSNINANDPILATGLSSSEIRNIELRTTNGQNLTDFVLIAGTSDVQSITGPMDIQRVTREYSLKIKDHVLNRCNLTEYRFSIQNGSLLLDQPSENNPDFAIVSLGASRKGRAQAVTVILHDAYLVHCATWYARGRATFGSSHFQATSTPYSSTF